MDRLETEVSTGSRIRGIAIQVSGIGYMLKPGYTVPEGVPDVLDRAGKELQALAVELDAYFGDLLKERHERRLAAMKGTVSRILRPAKKRR